MNVDHADAPAARRLILFRHAKSDWQQGTQDHDRPLSERGRLAAPSMGQYMAGEGLTPDLALISSARRARETWALASPAFADAVTMRDEPRIYEASVEALLTIVREVGSEIRTLLLVGHNPGFEDLGKLLAGRGERADLARLRSKVPTASLIVIGFGAETWNGVAPGRGRLERFVTPKSLGAGEED